VLVASLTRAAAAEVAGRDLPLPKDRIGTLHAHAYRALGLPKIAETKNVAIEFNDQHPELALSSLSVDLEDTPRVEDYRKHRNGDQSFAMYNLLRARMTPREFWPESVANFAAHWERWKAESDVLDFEDLIQRARTDCQTAPGRPALIYGDEAQDWSRSEHDLMDRWAEHAMSLVITGDWDQNIYSWRGSDPNAINEISKDPKHFKVLSQSYRVPRAVHALAERWISRIVGRVKAEYLPRDFDGEVIRRSSTYKYPAGLAQTAGEYLARGKTVMILAACSHMIDPIKHELKQRAVPFHNPHRIKRGDWQFLRPAKRLIDYLRPDVRTFDGQARNWTWKELNSWLHLLKAEGNLIRGAKTGIAEFAKLKERKNEVLTQADLDSVFEQVPRPGDIPWLEQRMKTDDRQRMAHVFRLAAEQPKKLIETPRLTIGTIHSVKGGQADVVILLPDLSEQGYIQWSRGGEGRDAVVRQFYVGMTRARETLVICRGSSGMAVRI